MIYVVVRFELLNLTTDELVKLDPFTIKVNDDPPVKTHDGEIPEIEGGGKSTINELLVPV